MELEKSEGRALTLTLRQIAGLGVNVTEIYPYGRCFLKGFFNAIEGFRDGRDMDGWRLATVMHQARCLDLGISVDKGIIPESSVEYPKYTRITSELKLHAESLL